jgi:hypothetical protein
MSAARFSGAGGWPAPGASSCCVRGLPAADAAAYLKAAADLESVGQAQAAARLPLPRRAGR